ncbi:zinc ribbon domain-containing protein [Streptomyces sp. NPDC005463]|uniref:zinc ribbon domain-containing protein n=1 Tax=Streptomyces sp. NPDC005463 TaxID=3154465 RepID=UPI0033BC443D
MRERPFSSTCAEGGHIDKKNRVDQATFICWNCRVVAHAGRNASCNIAQRGETAWTAGRESRVPAPHRWFGRRSPPSSQLDATRAGSS